MKDYTAIEALETRIAPAAIFTFTDVDGDLVTVKTSKGTNAELAAVITKSTPAGSVFGGEKLNTVNLAMNAVFDGTDLSITAKPGPLGGDALVSVFRINAAGLDLGTVKIGGDLEHLDAGKNTLTSKIKTIDIQSTSGAGIWSINANVGTLKVGRDLRGAEIVINASGVALGSLQIGGSLIGDTVLRSGHINVPNGTIGKVIIKGHIIAGMSADSGVILAKDILSVSIKGDVIGDTGANSGLIQSTGKLGNVTIGGSLIGGSASHSGNIEGIGGIGKVTIGRDVRGGSASDTGDIVSTAGGIAGVKIGGSLIGGSESFTGRIIALGGNIGPIQIGGDLASNDSPTGGLLIDSGQIRAVIGAFNDADLANIASITIGGSVRGNSHASNNAGQIAADGTIGAIKIGLDVLGGKGFGSGKIFGFSGILSVSIGGSLIGSSGEGSGEILAIGKLGSVSVGGDLLSSARIASNQSINTVKIGGSIVRSDILVLGADPVSRFGIKSVTIGGRVENGGILSTAADAQLGSIKIGGDWITSNLYTGIVAGADMFFGTADDAVSTVANNPALFSKIASITIGGQVKGTAGGTDRFGFVSQEIGSLKIHGVTVPLTKGRGNDTDVNNTRFILGTTRDVTVHEVL